MATIQIAKVTGTELYHRYPGQTSAQDCYVKLDMRDCRLTAECSGEIGNAVPENVWHGHIMRWSIPALKADAANELLADILPLAEHVYAGYEPAYNGSNLIARYDYNAREAMAAIESLCELVDADDELVVWEASDWLYGMGSRETQREALGIKAATTDEDLGTIERQLIVNAADNDIDMVEGLAEHLKCLRNEARNKSREESESVQSATI